MMGQVLALLADFLLVLLDLSALLLVLEWFVHFLPGTALHPVRRILFNTTFPILKLNQYFLSLKWGRFDTRGLLLALFFWFLGRFGVPWLVLLSYSLRQG